MKRMFRMAVCVMALSPVLVLGRESNPLPVLQEVYGLIRSNLVGASEAELDRAAVAGLVAQLEGRVMIVTNETVQVESLESVPLVSKSLVFENAFAFIRLSRVEAGAAQETFEAFEALQATNQLKGLVLDVRFAKGTDYGAANELARVFLHEPSALRGASTPAGGAGERTIGVPLVILANQQTARAAEAFIAALRRSETGLVIGSSTAGEAFVFTDFPLSTGGRLRVATAPVEAGDGGTLAGGALAPDISVAVNHDDERVWFEDPHAVLPRLVAQGDPGGRTAAGRVRRRLNESDLVRMQREGADANWAAEALAGAAQTPPVVYDPALARALDFLKGLSVVQGRR